MTPDGWEVPRSYWVLCLVDASTQFTLDDEEARRVMAAWKAQQPLVEFEDIFGSETVVATAAIRACWRWGDVQRARSAAFKREYDDASWREDS